MVACPELSGWIRAGHGAVHQRLERSLHVNNAIGHRDQIGKLGEIGLVEADIAVDEQEVCRQNNALIGQNDHAPTATAGNLVDSQPPNDAPDVVHRVPAHRALPAEPSEGVPQQGAVLALHP